jgi:DNA repair exonuclease SbcCD nuclease subunit
VKIAIISDAHLFHTFSDTYDSVADFERAISQITNDESPEALFLAGDMFDYKKTETMYLRHYEGEGHMIKIRDALKRFRRPVYAIKGNHDKEQILEGLAQTVTNFHYDGSSVTKFGDLAMCFMNSHYETGGYYEETTIENMHEFLKRAIEKIKPGHNKPGLLCHETFAPYENSIPPNFVDFLKESFEIVLNGHMHFWNPTTYASSHIICLPSLLPSRIVKGKYATERYHWLQGNANFAKAESQSPFGYVILDTESAKARIHEYVPSKKLVEVTLDATGLSLEEARKRVRLVFSAIDERADKKGLIILPELNGNIAFPPLYLETVRQEFPELHVEPIRYEQTTLVATLDSATLTAPTLTVAQLVEKLKSNIPQMVSEIKAKGVVVDESTISRSLNALLGQELVVRSQAVPQNRTRLQFVLTSIFETLSQSGDLKRPPNLEGNIANLLKMVR